MFKKVLTFIAIITFEMIVIVWAASSPITHFLQGL